MTPERRARVLHSLREIRHILNVASFDDSVDGSCQLEHRSDLELSLLLTNLEALLERAQGTDI